MKKLALAILGLTVVGSSVFAQTNQVLSRNAVGYVRIDAPAGSLKLVRHDFIDLAGGQVYVTNMIGNQLANGSSLYLWDPSNQVYAIANKGPCVWSPLTNVLRRGACIFMRSSSNSTVYLMGEVPDATTAPTSKVYGLNGFNLAGVPYPVDTAFTSTPFYLGAASGDSLYTWDGADYGIYNRGTRLWTPATITNVIIKAGEGFWYFRAGVATTNWTFPKPYTWP